MLKDKLADVRDFIVRHCKSVFPLIVVVVVAFTVAFALNYDPASAEKNDPGEDGSVSGNEADGSVQLDLTADVPLVQNEDSDIYTLVATYYNAWGTGDMEALASVYDVVPENDLLKYLETSRYLSYYTALQVYTKQGLEEGSFVAYVYYRVCFVDHPEEFPGYETLYICKDGQGEYYIKNEANFTQEENDYIIAVSKQEDVIEFNNRVTAEYNELMKDDSSLLAYLKEVTRQVEVAMGVALAEQNIGDGQGDGTLEGQDGGDQPQDGGNPEQQGPAQEATPEYATSTTRVNVRSSDSEQADKLGQIPQGTRLKVQEVRINGWTKVIFEGKDGYIKSDYLQFTESAAGQSTIGTVTATTLVNIRSMANETSERLGQLATGESLDLLGTEGDWCKVIYDGQVAYVKAEFVEQR